mmetsp:Transcript_115594/g.333959  ORF Transcript_115594/g.333959 Transcript_115594/m.333959 type:complete len:394 (+) Transcript_115594:113-1294(+)
MSGGMRLGADAKGMTRPMSPASNGSLAISAFSTPETQAREPRNMDGKLNVEDLKCAVPLREKNANSTVMAKFDVSDLFAPLEARFMTQLSELDAKFERRCCAIERQMGMRSAAGESSGSRSTVPDNIGRRLSDLDEAVAQLTRQSKESLDSASTIRRTVGDLRQQMKTDRQESFDKLQNLSEALESRLSKLYDKVESALLGDGCMAGMLECSPAESSTGGTGIQRWRSVPALEEARLRGEPVAAAAEPHEDQGGPPVEASRLPLRHCSVPTSCLPSRGDDRSSPNHSPTSTAHRSVHQQQRPQQQQNSATRQPGTSSVVHQRAPGQGSPLMNNRTMGNSSSSNYAWTSVGSVGMVPQRGAVQSPPASATRRMQQGTGQVMRSANAAPGSRSHV